MKYQILNINCRRSIEVNNTLMFNSILYISCRVSCYFGRAEFGSIAAVVRRFVLVILNDTHTKHEVALVDI